MKSFLAMITPIDSGAYPDQTLPGPQPPSGTKPPPKPDQTLPGDLPIPSHPIYYPLPPGAPVDPDYGVPVLPGMEGGAPRPDQGLPGSQPKPDQSLPGPQPHPEHPIVLPPDSGGWLPVYIWGPTDPRPGTGLPGDQPKPDQGLPIPPPTEEEKAKVEWKAMWTPTTGWVSFAIVVPGSGTPVPTPSKKK